MATKVRSYSKGPCTCARNFEHVVQLFIKDVLKSDEMPIGEIADFFSEWNFNKNVYFVKEFNYLQNPLKRNVSTTYSQFPLIIIIIKEVNGICHVKCYAEQK